MGDRTHNIATQGKWSATSGKQKSLDMMFVDTDEYYQSCSPVTPHNIFCQFYHEHYVECVKIRLYMEDDTYFPECIKILGGSRRSLVTIGEWSMTPTLMDAWITIPVRENTFTLCISVVAVNGGGQDVRLSEVQVIGC
eukprot:NODE_343_length_10566_cov_0.542371.p7 type:complete len:138 gc:universal NODE_343_length_10566_cov_0.542371:10439-10026(-)